MGKPKAPAKKTPTKAVVAEKAGAASAAPAAVAATAVPAADVNAAQAEIVKAMGDPTAGAQGGAGEEAKVAAGAGAPTAGEALQGEVGKAAAPADEDKPTDPPPPPAADHADAEYKCVSPLNHDGVFYGIGKPVRLTPAQAAPLLGHTVVREDD